MPEVSLDELREVSRRARAAHRWGAGVVVLGMAAVPAFVTVSMLAPGVLPWAAVAALVVVGGAFVRYAHVVGQSRGAFRKLFREVRTREKTRRVAVVDVTAATRTAEPEAGAPSAP